ncbi:PREDICTED: aldo-keto reductase AKR2E4-like [Papilio polytes]|uniref:aldo-keto reductase AKR2E4-like n=1 Tax=Papilio polytes TaxID=76194 RepID=UPI000676890E|nr:PREDICTED: aldo-keto reductase AKR2E4-like [Papilio polytes]
MAKVNIPTFKLNNGLEMPALGYGTWLGLDEKNVFNIQDAPKLVEALSYAIDIGYRHIDTAHLYRVEPEIGQVVKRKITEGVVKREDLFITTKVWQHNHREADVEKSLRASLKRLDMDYVDLVLIHWPMSISSDGVDEKIDYLKTYRGLEAALRAGLTRAIGVSNFNLQQMSRLLDNCNVIPATNQIEYQRGIATIPKSLTKSRILENASIFDFELDEKDVAEIAKFDNGYRTDVPSFWQEYENYPFDKIPEPEKEIPLSLLKWKNGANLDID